MRVTREQAIDLDVHPLTPERWNDFVTPFNGRGGSQVRSCWCMYYRRSGRTEPPPDTGYAEHNKRSLKALVDRFGAKAMYDRAGFVEVARRVARRKPARPVMRKTL